MGGVADQRGVTQQTVDVVHTEKPLSDRAFKQGRVKQEAYPRMRRALARRSGSIAGVRGTISGVDRVSRGGIRDHGGPAARALLTGTSTGPVRAALRRVIPASEGQPAPPHTHQRNESTIIRP